MPAVDDRLKTLIMINLQKTRRCGRNLRFLPVLEKSEADIRHLSDLNDRPQGLLWPETGRYSRGTDSSIL